MNQVKMLLKTFKFRVITVHEVVGFEIDPGSLSHQVCHDLHDLLLLQGTSNVLVTLEVNRDQFCLQVLEFSFFRQQVIQQLLAISGLSVELCLEQKMGAERGQEVLQLRHILQRAVIHHVDAELVFHVDFPLFCVEVDAVLTADQFGGLLGKARAWGVFYRHGQGFRVGEMDTREAWAGGKDAV